jgi:DNA ligase-1
VLEFLLNTDKKTGISTSKLLKDLSNKDIVIKHVESLQELLDYLLEHNSGKDEDILVAQCFINDIENVTLKRFVSDLVTKKYKCGLTAKVASEILPDIIKNEHEIMLAHKFEGKLPGAVSISLKLDGIRCTALIDEKGHIVFKTRQGKIIKGLLEIKMALKAYNLTSCMLDGELIRINKENLPSDENFRLTTEIVNSKSEDKKGLEFVLFDVTSLSAYQNKKCDMEYQTRMILLSQLINKESKFIRLVPTYGVTDDIARVYQVLDEVTSQGLEGLMLNTLTGEYRFGKRSKELLKVKKMHTCDIKCTGIEEGEGKYEGTLGKIVCDYKGFELRVGSGFTDEQRVYFWDNQDEIIGQLVEIQYFEESKDKKTGDLSLRFPVFKRVRYDKVDVSYD